MRQPRPLLFAPPRHPGDPRKSGATRAATREARRLRSIRAIVARRRFRRPDQLS